MKWTAVRVATLAAAVLILVSLVAFIGSAMISMAKRDDAFMRCSVALNDPRYMTVQKDGTIRSTYPEISLRWSWRRRAYMCVYHDYKRGLETVSPAPLAPTRDG